MKVLCCGSRGWDSWEPILDFFKEYKQYITCVIHGDCRGADKMCGQIAERLKIRVEKYPAKWDEYGKSAGMIRNREMIEQNPDLVVAFSNNLDTSRGTKNMISLAEQKGVNVLVISETSGSKA